MILHYLKIAFRNLWKYKSQTLISLIGLAVGFTCFALSMLWIRYEMSFDSFHKNAKQLYVVLVPNTFNQSGYTKRSKLGFSTYLKETFPEITNAASVTYSPYNPSNEGTLKKVKAMVDDVEYPVLIIDADSSFFGIFDVKILTGTRDFLISGSKKFAITQEKARQLFGNENPLGKIIKINNSSIEICAVVSDISKRSNYVFDLIQPFSVPFVQRNEAGQIIMQVTPNENSIIELLPGTNVKAFEKKLLEHEINIDFRGHGGMKITPLIKLRYTDPDIIKEVRFQHIVFFAISGFLIIVLTLFNYFTLFISRFRIRQKELALRMVYGAAKGSLLMMLTVEFVLTLILSVAVGCVFIQWLHQPFQKLSDIQMDLPAIYWELFLYVSGVIMLSLFVFWSILFIFRRRSLNLSIHRSNKNLSRKMSIIIQLIISVGFAFSSVVIMKQLYFLHHTEELGFSLKNRGTIVMPGGKGDVLTNQLKQIPEITEVVDATGMTVLIPWSFAMTVTISGWDDKSDDDKSMILNGMTVSMESLSFYDFKLAAGEMLTEADPDSLVLINESAVKTFGWHNPIGKHFSGYMVKGVIKNVYNFAPTMETKSSFYAKPSQWQRERSSANVTVLFKYQEGMWKSCKEKIDQLIEKEYTNLRSSVYNVEETYDKFLKSENALIKLLSFVSAICILICVFGFVSLVSLTLEERRKSIAIHKINGATSGNILAIFAKEYSLLLLIGSVIAFSTGFFIMQRWLEQYVKQTSISVWIYFSILFVMALIIVLCVGWQVWRASVENPSEVVKKEN